MHGSQRQDREFNRHSFSTAELGLPRKLLIERVKVLSDYKTVMALAWSGALEKAGKIDAKHTVLIRTQSSTFLDLDKDGKLGDGEKAKVYNAAYAIEGNVEEGSEQPALRAMVVGTMAPFSDTFANSSKQWVAGQFFIDGLKWLTREDQIIGEPDTQEDVKIDHSPSGQKAWFWITTLGVPLLVLLFGIFQLVMRRRRQ